MRKIVWILVVLVSFVSLSGLRSSGPAFAEDSGVGGLWFFSELPYNSEAFKIRFSTTGSFHSECYDQDFVEEKGAGQDRYFTPGVDTLKTICEGGVYTVSGDSVIIDITGSDIADRIGITFTVTYSRAGGFITFTNALELTFGYVDEEQVTFYDRYYDDPEPFEGRWAIYRPDEGEGFSAIIGIRLQGGSFFSYGGVATEQGTYILSGDSLTITITESGLPDRVGVSFTVTFSLDLPNTYAIVFTNASMLTAGWTQEETITMGPALTAVRPATWGNVKLLFK